MSTVTVVRGENPASGKSPQSPEERAKLGDSERLVSMVAAAALTGLAFRSRGMFRSLGLLGLATGMVQRGVTGKCSFGKAIACLDKAVNGKKCSNHSEGKPKKDNLDKAGMDSFPASDPPSFTPEDNPKPKV